MFTEQRFKMVMNILGRKRIRFNIDFFFVFFLFFFFVLVFFVFFFFVFFVVFVLFCFVFFCCLVLFCFLYDFLIFFQNLRGSDFAKAFSRRPSRSRKLCCAFFLVLFYFIRALVKFLRVFWFLFRLNAFRAVTKSRCASWQVASNHFLSRLLRRIDLLSCMFYQTHQMLSHVGTVKKVFTTSSIGSVLTLLNESVVIHQHRFKVFNFCIIPNDCSTYFIAVAVFIFIFKCIVTIQVKTKKKYMVREFIKF